MTTGTHTIPTPSYDRSLVRGSETGSEEPTAGVIGREWRGDLTDTDSPPTAAIGHEGQTERSDSHDGE